MSEPKDRALNWQQVCRAMPCSKSFFYLLIKTGRLKAFKVGKVYGLRVRQSELDRFLADSLIQVKPAERKG